MKDRFDRTFDPVVEFALEEWELGDTHGFPHWKRVERNGVLLSLQECDGGYDMADDINIDVVRLFAYLHDKCRIDDYEDLSHGERAAEMLHTIRGTLLSCLNDEEFMLLETACRFHTTKHKTGNRTVDICFDADRLDLGRVGIAPDPRLMATEQGAYYAQHPDAFYKLIQYYESNFAK